AVVLAESDDTEYEIGFHKLILATGARERFLPFPGWTLPGVVGAGGLQALVKSGAPILGARVVIAGSGPLLLAVGADRKGHRAQGAVDSRASPIQQAPGILALAGPAPPVEGNAGRNAETPGRNALSRGMLASRSNREG